MTARQDVRVGTRSRDGDTWSFETQRAPHVGEILQTARQRKGVDLGRAERDTKIRAKHLMALESGDFDDLPARVYTKGFLRNYSTYLGLDAEEMLSRWRREIDQPRTSEPVKVTPPPQPITAQGRGFKLTSGLIVALVLAAVVAGFLGYVGLQLVRFTQNPEVTVSGPSLRWLPTDATRVVIAGSADPGAVVTATGADDLVRTTEASATGSWSLDLPVSTGRNDFAIVSTDLETGRDSEPVEIIATVPVDEAAVRGVAATPALPEGASRAAGAAPSAEVVLTSPAQGGTLKKGRLRLAGTSDAEAVLVSFQWRGNPDRERVPPAPTELAVTDGTFRGDFRLPKGRWQVSVAAQVGGGAPAIATIPVKAAYDKTVLKVTAVDGFTRIRVTPAGDDEQEILSGVRLEPGESRSITSEQDLVLRVGNAKAAQVVVDGVDYGPMGKKPEAKAWLIEKGKAPQPLR